MENKSSKTKRIAKNTIILYIRMIVVLLITLYTSRLVLKALGVDDFGLYNVVGGVVGLLTFFNGTMLKSTQRFLNVAMVKGEETLKGIFASSITVHIIIAILFLLLSESLGLWFLNAKVNIPEGREFAANIVYQASVLSFCISIIGIPCNAVVVAYEKMTYLAVVSIIDAVLKLLIAILLLYYSNDRLILYSLMVLFIAVINIILYYLYCRKRHSNLNFYLSFDKEYFKQIFSFVSWTLVGQMAVVGCNQGNIVLVNMFHSLSANAAMSIGSQISNAITNLTTNFQTAFNPQITKSFAENRHDYLSSLVYMTSKISFCILFVVALPVAFNIDWVLQLWLGKAPALANTFAILFMVNAILNAISMPFNFTVLSSGNIRNFQIVTAIVFLMDIPITYTLFYLGYPVVTVLWVKIGVMATMFFVRVFYSTTVVNNIKMFSVCREVLLPIIITGGISINIALYLLQYANSLGQRFFLTILLEIVIIIMIWVVCLTKGERTSLLKMIKRINK